MQNGFNSFLETPYGFVIFFVSLWCFVCFLVSLFSGWHRLTGRFQKQSEPYGETKSAGPFFYGVKMRFRTNYRNVIRITAAEDAVYLSMLFLFRIGHPPLRVPWKEIQFKRTKFLWLKYVVLMIGERERIPMRISERMAVKLGLLERMAQGAAHES